MKARFYLRGLGIGIVVTALIMGIGRKDQKPLTDAEIKARAAMLGMVESGNASLSDIAENRKDTAEITKQPEESAEPEDTKQPEESAEPEETKQPEESAEPEATKQPEESAEPEATRQPEESAEPEATKQPEESAEPEDTTPPVGEDAYVTLTISRGNGSDQVCKALEKLGLIEDWKEYDQYLIAGGYSTRLRVGTYHIPVDAGEEEIAHIITGKAK